LLYPDDGEVRDETPQQRRTRLQRQRRAQRRAGLTSVGDLRSIDARLNLLEFVVASALDPSISTVRLRVMIQAVREAHREHAITELDENIQVALRRLAQVEEQIKNDRR
jgi:hypothetical protein